MQRVSLKLFILPLLSGTGFSVLTSSTESCDEDDEEVGVGVVEDLVDNQGPRMVHSLIFCNQFFAIPDEMWFLTPGPVVCIPTILTEFPMERIARVSSRSITLTNKSNCLTHIVASLFLRTSPLAVITVVGLL